MSAQDLREIAMNDIARHLVEVGSVGEIDELEPPVAYSPYIICYQDALDIVMSSKLTDSGVEPWPGGEFDDSLAALTSETQWIVAFKYESILAEVWALAKIDIEEAIITAEDMDYIGPLSFNATNQLGEFVHHSETLDGTCIYKDRYKVESEIEAIEKKILPGCYIMAEWWPTKEPI